MCPKKINKMPKFYMIFARKNSFCPNLGGGATAPLPRLLCLSTCWLSDWLIDRFTYLFICLLIYWFVNSLCIDWLTVSSIDLSIVWLYDWLMDGWIDVLICRLCDWSIDWLNDWMIDSLINDSLMCWLFWLNLWCMFIRTMKMLRRLPMGTRMKSR